MKWLLTPFSCSTSQVETELCCTGHDTQIVYILQGLVTPCLHELNAGTVKKGLICSREGIIELPGVVFQTQTWARALSRPIMGRLVTSMPMRRGAAAVGLESSPVEFSAALRASLSPLPNLRPSSSRTSGRGPSAPFKPGLAVKALNTSTGNCLPLTCGRAGHEQWQHNAGVMQAPFQ